MLITFQQTTMKSSRRNLRSFLCLMASFENVPMAYAVIATEATRDAASPMRTTPHPRNEMREYKPRANAPALLIALKQSIARMDTKKMRLRAR